MRCTLHLNRPAAGYCRGCGSFFCESCLILCDDENKYCSSCVKKLKKSRKEESGVARTGRLAVMLMVNLKNGVVLKGTTYNLDPARGGFHFVRQGRDTDAEITIKFSDVKYVAIVESFAEGPRKSPGEYRPKGSEVMVVFKDGERLDGYTLSQYNDKLPRFPIIPRDPKDNRLSILVERSSIEHMTLGRIPKAQELRKLVANSVRRLILHYYWKHPNIVITLDELATRLERTARAVERDLGVFMEEGLISPIGTPNRKQLKFSPAADVMVREVISSMGREIDMLYFRKRSGEKPPPASKYAGHSPGKWGI